MKKLLTLAASLILLASCSTASKEEDRSAEFIRIEGVDLVNPDGSKYFIVGTNFGNWLNPEGYMFGFGRASSARLINQMFCELAGPDRAAEFWSRFKDNYVTEKDVEFIASTGANTIRIPFNYRLFTNEDYMGSTGCPEEGFKYMDRAVEWCRKYNIHVILDMHDCPGGQTGDNIDDSYGYPWLFESEASQELFYDIWVRIADHYKNEPVILGYELMNEPIAPYFDNVDELNAKFLPINIEAAKRIRTVDPNHIVIIGSPQWNTNFSVCTDWTFDDKIMFTCHRYGGEAGVEGIQEYIDFRDKVQLPMYMGEIGHNTMEWQGTYSQVMKDQNIGYTYWPYKKLEKECMVAFDMPENWQSVIDFAESDRGDFFKIRTARPDQEMSWKSMLQLLENLKFENCKPLKPYINSMLLDCE